MGCFAVKRKPCSVIAHVIDQDIEPEEWAEVYEALSGPQALLNQDGHVDANRLSLDQEGLINRRRSSFIHAMRQSFRGGVNAFDGAAHTRLREQPGLLESQSHLAAGGSVQLLMSTGKKSCRDGKRHIQVFPCASPEADPLLELETFNWNKALGLRLRNARTGKLLMTLVPVNRPAPPPSAALPEDCQLPGIDLNELDASWELCRIYADGRVVASVRTFLEAPTQPPSCWQDFTAPLKRRTCRQTFRVWVAATGAVEAACSRCPSFKTDDSSGHELTWALSRGLGVSVLGQPLNEERGQGLGVSESGGLAEHQGEFDRSECVGAGIGFEVNGRSGLGYGARLGNRVSVQREVRDYWAQVADAQRRWDDRDCVTSAEVAEGSFAVREPGSGLGSVNKAGAVSNWLAANALAAETGRDAKILKDGIDSVAERAELGANGCEMSGREEPGAGHGSRRSIESVDEYFDSRSVRNSDSGSEANFTPGVDRELKRTSSKSLGFIDIRRDVMAPTVETEIASHCRSRSAEYFQRVEDVPRVSSRFWLGKHLAAEGDSEPNNTARPPLRRMGMLESFFSSQKSGWPDSPRNPLERPLLSYRTSGLEYDPIADARPLQPQGSSIPSAFNTSAMVPLSVDLDRRSQNKLDIVFRTAGSDQRLEEGVIASARGSGFACKKRMSLDISASCPADTLALTMLAQYLRVLVDFGQ